MALIIPESQNNPTWPAQAVLDNTDLNALYLLGQATGVISGFQLSGSLTNPSSTVISGNITSGTYSISGTYTSVSAAGFQTLAASTGDRRDIVIASGTTVSVVQGTAITIAGWNNGSVVDPPVKPAVPSGTMLIGEIYVPGTAAFTAISNTWYTDKTAIFVPIPGPQGNQGYQGYQGYQGFQGSQGYQSGVQGYQGYQGYQGPTDLVTSATEPSNRNVLWLDTAATGNGTQGAQGAAGSQGSQGSQGAQGMTAFGTYWTPSAQNGFLAWDFDPTAAATVGAPTKGQVFYIGFISPVAITVNSIVFFVTNAGTSVSTSYAGIYSQSGALLQGSSDFSAALMTAGTATASLTASYTMAANTVYYVAFLIGNGTTTSPSLLAAGSSTGSGLAFNAGTSFAANTLAGGARVSTVAGTTLTALPSQVSGTPSSGATVPRIVWFGLK